MEDSGPFVPSLSTGRAAAEGADSHQTQEFGWLVSAAVLAGGLAAGWLLAVRGFDLVCMLNEQVAPLAGAALAMALYGALALLNPRFPASVLKGMLLLVIGLVCLGLLFITHHDREEALEAVLAASNVLVVPQAKKSTIQLVVEGVVSEQEIDVLGSRMRVPIVLYGPRAVEITVAQLARLNLAARRRYGAGACVNVHVEPAPAHTVASRPEIPQK